MIEIEPIDAGAFAPFGRVLRLCAGQADGAAPDGVVLTDGPGWSDAYSAEPLLSRNASLGMTRAGAVPFAVTRMERHPNTEEALFCADAPIVLVVSPAGREARPWAGALRAFAIPPGTVAVMKPGTWHDACRGLDGKVTYYWMATVRTGTEWQDVDGGPVEVVRGEGA